MEGLFGMRLSGFGNLSTHAQFPNHWQLSPDAADKYEHIIPVVDGADEGAE